MRTSDLPARLASSPAIASGRSRGPLPVRPCRGRTLRAAPTGGRAGGVRPRRAVHSSRRPAPRATGGGPGGRDRRTAARDGHLAVRPARRDPAPGTWPRPARWPAACRPAGRTPARPRPSCPLTARRRDRPHRPGPRTAGRPRRRRPPGPSRRPAAPAAAPGRPAHREHPGVPRWLPGTAPAGTGQAAWPPGPPPPPGHARSCPAPPAVHGRPALARARRSAWAHPVQAHPGPGRRWPGQGPDR